MGRSEEIQRRYELVRDEMDSQADLSIHPTRARVQLRHIPPWAIVAIVGILAAALAYAVAR